MTATPCPCGRPLPYDQCCGRFHHQKALPETAEELMRSRYSAFAWGLADYLLATLHPGRHRADERSALEQSFRDTHWEGLTVLNCTEGGPHDTQGTVEFIARFGSGQQRGQIHERSRFTRETQQWLYVDGDMLPAKSPGRNDPCWCGSGKKFKKCHG